MKIGFLITARLKSSRLPLKLLKDLNGKPVIERVIERTKAVKTVSDTILCTSTNSQDRPLIDIARDTGVYYFAGDEEDVLQRLCAAAVLYELDYVLSITADNPLFSLYHSEIIADELKRNDYDYVRVINLPLGTGTYGLKVKALKVACAAKSIANTEIWGYLMDRPELFKIKKIDAGSIYNRPELRLTLDYPEDYELINTIYRCIPFGSVLPLHTVIEYLDEHPSLIEINQDCVQRVLDSKTKKEVDRAYDKHFDKIKRIKEEIYTS